MGGVGGDDLKLSTWWHIIITLMISSSVYIAMELE